MNRSKISRFRQILNCPLPSHPKPILWSTNIRVSFLWTTLGMAVLPDRLAAQAGKRQTACKPGSVRPVKGRDDHSSGTHLTMRLTRPTRTAGRKHPCGHYGYDTVAPRPPLFGLAPGGVYLAAPVARGAVRSCRTVSPLPAGLP